MGLMTESIPSSSRSRRARQARRGSFYSTEDDLLLYEMIVGRTPTAEERCAALARPSACDHDGAGRARHSGFAAATALARKVAGLLSRRKAT